jgi:hypothetical protein
VRIVIDTSSFIRATLERDRASWQCIRDVMLRCEIIATEELAKNCWYLFIFVAERKATNPLPEYRIAGLFLLKTLSIETTSALVF